MRKEATNTSDAVKKLTRASGTTATAVKELSANSTRRFLELRTDSAENKKYLKAMVSDFASHFDGIKTLLNKAAADRTKAITTTETTGKGHATVQTTVQKGFRSTAKGV